MVYLKKILLCVLVILCLFGCVREEEEGQPDETPAEYIVDDEGQKYANNHLVVTFSSELSDKQKEEVKKIVSAKEIRSLYDNVYVIEFEPVNFKAINSYKEKISALDYVLACEFDYIVEIPDCNAGPC